jgi:hypothetical protein
MPLITAAATTIPGNRLLVTKVTNDFSGGFANRRSGNRSVGVAFVCVTFENV